MPSTTPRGRKARRELPRLPWMDAFIAVLKEGRNISRAASSAGIAPSTAYVARGRHKKFTAEWDAALAKPPPTPSPPAAILEPGKRSPRWPQQFLAVLAETSNVSLAAACAGAETSAVYRKRRTDPEFAARWQEAILEGYEHLELEVLGHLRSPDPARKMDVAAALRLLAAHRETAIRLKALAGEEDEQAVRDSIDRFLEDMRQRRLANEAMLVEAQAKDDDVTG